MSWDGEKTLTFTMEDALISVDSLALLAAAKGEHYDATKNKKIHAQKRLGVQKTVDENHKLEESYVQIDENGETITLHTNDALENVAAGDLVYVLAADEGGFDSEPFLYQVGPETKITYAKLTKAPEDWAETYTNYYIDEKGTTVPAGDSAPTFSEGTYYEKVETKRDMGTVLEKCSRDIVNTTEETDDNKYKFTTIGKDGLEKLKNATAVYLDYYVTGKSFTRLTIEPDSFGSNFYIEADTLFRDKNGADYAAIFTIPNCRVQSNFTITMASSGDPSSFQFTIDAFPGYTRFDQTKEVLAAIDIMDEVYGVDTSRNYRTATNDIEETK